MYTAPLKVMHSEMWQHSVFTQLRSMRSLIQSRAGKRREAYCCIATISLAPMCGEYVDTWKELAKPLELRPPVSIAEPLGSGCSWPLRPWVQYL